MQLEESCESGINLIIADALAFRTWSSIPFARAASCVLRIIASAFEAFGLMSRAKTLACGTSSDSNSNRLDISSTVMMLTPVRLPPGGQDWRPSPLRSGPR